MAPIYESDVKPRRTEDGWIQEEWRTFEFWEKIEQIRKRKRLIWIAATALAFLVLSAVPSLIDRRPKWQALKVTRSIAQMVLEIKGRTATEHHAFAVQFGPGLSYRVEARDRCGGKPGVPGNLVREGKVGETDSELTIVSVPDADRLGLTRVITGFCFDPLDGLILDGGMSVDTPSGIGVIPVNDLTDSRIDRISVVLLTGGSADISFN
jgi:hypothetical protein